MQRSCRWIAGIFSVVMLCGCGIEIVAQPTPVAPTASPERVAEVSVVPTVETTPSPVPSPTVPPTTSPLPTSASSPGDTIVATVAPVATVEATTPPANQPTTAPAGEPTTAPANQPTLAAAATPTDTEAALRLIRERFEAVNNAVPGFQRTEQELQGFSTEGGTLETLYENEVLRKMIATYLGESGKATEEYYYWEDELIFILRVDSTYDKPFGTVVQTTENRYYFANNLMIRWIDEAGQQVPPAEPLFAERQQQVRQQEQELYGLLP